MGKILKKCEKRLVKTGRMCIIDCIVDKDLFIRSSLLINLGS
jgi:hypothetical protein